ncbi:hypothetical protein V5N11_019528 [Cardamine amara subsp. amara]|uniref:DUF4283 domain-containing protein n=1 Tax=Cardamine amara subsp. amara TaxID=228776 RepID=A0ABD0ZY95_CARAN
MLCRMKENLTHITGGCGLSAEIVAPSKAPQQGSQSHVVTSSSVVSWLNIVYAKKYLKKYDLDIVNQTGVNSVVALPEIFKDTFPLWEDFFIGRFLATNPHVAKIHAIVNKIWAMGDRSQMIEVFEVNSTTMKFQISNPEIRNRVLRRGLWNLADIPLVMSKWTPLVEESSVEVKTVPLWVHLKNVPMDMYS